VRLCLCMSADNCACRVARLAGNTILQRNGVIRHIVNLGVLQLPQKIRAFKTSHVDGHYFLLRFYAGPYVIQDIKQSLKLDPRLLRVNVVKLGAKSYSFPLSYRALANWSRLKHMMHIRGDYSLPDSPIAPSS